MKITLEVYEEKYFVSCIADDTDIYETMNMIYALLILSGYSTELLDQFIKKEGNEGPS